MGLHTFLDTTNFGIGVSIEKSIIVMCFITIYLNLEWHIVPNTLILMPKLEYYTVKRIIFLI